jgi:hypothetical protein
MRAANYILSADIHERTDGLREISFREWIQNTKMRRNPELKMRFQRRRTEHPDKSGTLQVVIYR